MEPNVHAALHSSVTCPECGAPAGWWGVQVLVGDSLRWDVESACPACGFAVAECDGLLPDGTRERLLAEHGQAWLRVGASANRLAVMRVLRVALRIGLTDVEGELSRVLSGDCSGTLPEMELLARKLRAAGIDAVASQSV